MPVYSAFKTRRENILNKGETEKGRRNRQSELRVLFCFAFEFAKVKQKGVEPNVVF